MQYVSEKRERVEFTDAAISLIYFIEEEGRGEGDLRFPYFTLVAPTITVAITQSSLLRLRQAWRVPFSITQSPAFRWTSAPSSSSSQHSPDRMMS